MFIDIDTIYIDHIILFCAINFTLFCHVNMTNKSVCFLGCIECCILRR